MESSVSVLYSQLAINWFIGFDKVGRFGEILPALLKLGCQIGFSNKVKVGNSRSYAVWYDEKHIHRHALANNKVHKPWCGLA